MRPSHTAVPWCWSLTALAFRRFLRWLCCDRAHAHAGILLGSAELYSLPCRQYSGASSLPEVVPSSSWEIKPEDIVIAKHSDGSDWEIGSGGFGKASLRHRMHMPAN